MSNIMMKDTPEMRSAAFGEAKQRLDQMKLHGITTGMTQEQIDEKVIELTEKKAQLTGKSISSLAAGQEWYVNCLVEYAGMTAEQRYLWGKEQSFADTATDDELLDALAG